MVKKTRPTTDEIVVKIRKMAVKLKIYSLFCECSYILPIIKEAIKMVMTKTRVVCPASSLYP